MAIIIKQRGETYRIELKDEEWECKSKDELHFLLDELLVIKGQHGKIKEFNS